VLPTRLPSPWPRLDADRLERNISPVHERNWTERFFPDAAGRVISVAGPTPGGNMYLWSSWPQMAVTACYAVGFLAIGAYLFRKRDA